MIDLKSPAEIKIMREAGQIVADALSIARDNIHPGVTTKEIDVKVEEYILKCGATPSFKGYGAKKPFPAATCISVNEVVVHGIPSDRKLIEGDIVSIDIGAYYKNYHGDAARTFPVGAISSEKRRLIDVTRESYYAGVKEFRVGNRISDISAAIQICIESNGFHAVRALIGHGVGQQLHEEPDVPNFGSPGRGVRIANGMTLAIEPMVGMGTYEVYEKNDGWTICTKDHSPAAHYENSTALFDGEIIILTQGGEE